MLLGFETHTAYLQFVDILDKLNKYLHIYIKVIYVLQGWPELDFSPGVNEVSSKMITIKNVYISSCQHCLSIELIWEW